MPRPMPPSASWRSRPQRGAAAQGAHLQALVVLDLGRGGVAVVATAVAVGVATQPREPTIPDGVMTLDVKF